MIRKEIQSDEKINFGHVEFEIYDTFKKNCNLEYWSQSDYKQRFNNYISQDRLTAVTNSPHISSCGLSFLYNFNSPLCGQELDGNNTNSMVENHICSDPMFITVIWSHPTTKEAGKCSLGFCPFSYERMKSSIYDVTSADFSNLPHTASQQSLCCDSLSKYQPFWKENTDIGEVL